MTEIPVCDHSHIKKNKTLNIYALGLKRQILQPQIFMFTIDFQPIQNKREEKVAVQSYRYIKRERKYKKNVQIKAGNCFTVAILFLPVEQLFRSNPISPNTRGAGAAHSSPLIDFQTEKIIKKISSAQSSCKTQFVEEPLVKLPPHILFPPERH